MKKGGINPENRFLFGNGNSISEGKMEKEIPFWRCFNPGKFVL